MGPKSEPGPALYRLMAWLSPSYPVGAFAYSHGLEWMIEDGTVTDAASLERWVGDVLTYGAGRNDAILLGQAWDAARVEDHVALKDVADLAAALSPGRERKLETMAQGTAFLKTSLAAWPTAHLDSITASLGDSITASLGDSIIASLGDDVAYPVAIGLVAAAHGIGRGDVTGAFLHGFAANLISAGVRIIPLGQTEGQRALARLEATVAAVVTDALAASLDDVGGIAILTDIASMRHETQYTRLFRS